MPNQRDVKSGLARLREKGLCHAERSEASLLSA